MKKNYATFKKILAVSVFATLAGSSHMFGQVTTQTISYTGAIQQFTVPTLCVSTITIQAKGAQGGFNTASTISSGLGADMTGVFPVTAGQILKILVGQQPSNTASNGGGGGTFVTDMSNNPLLIAGGGGGSAGATDLASKHGQSGTAGGQGAGQTGGVGGTNGQGGSIGTGSSFYSGGGGGLLTDGASGTTAGSGGGAFVNGGIGAAVNGPGGFGGGGAGSLNFVGGGGGGYSGGGGGANNGGVGGGGGSYNGGTGQVNVSGTNSGNGVVIISYILGTPISTTVNPSAVCAGNSSTLSASAMVSYTWLPAGSFAGSNATSVIVTPASTTAYTVQGTNSMGCISTAVLTISVNNGTPTVTINSNSTTACQGQSITLTASGANTYTWNNSVVNGVAFVPPAGTTTYVVTGANACNSATAAVTLTISALPVTATASSTLICSGSPATLTAGGATTYTWNPGLSTQTVNFVSPAASTIYTVTGKSGPCSATATLAITTKTLPAISIVTQTTTICYGNTISLNAVGDATNYSWSVNGQTGTSISVSPTITSIYMLTGTNVVNCSKTISQIITVNPNPVISVSASNPEVCANGSSTLSASGAPTYSWSNSALTSTTVVNPATDATFIVSGINPTTTCHTESMITVTVFLPVLSVSGNTSVCTGSNVGISATGAISYTWANNGNTTQGITVSPAANTIYTVSGSVVNPINGITCPATNTLEVDVFTPPSITATSNHTAICRGATASLTADGAGATGTYTWTGGLGNNPVISVAPILNQTYVVNGTDANGCKGTATVQVAVDGCTGINTLAAGSVNLSIYPNPNSGEFTVTADQAITLHLVNELGQQVKEIVLNAATPELKINNLANGVYFIIGKNENGSVKEKLVITK